MKKLKQLTKKEKEKLILFAKTICSRPSIYVGGPPDFEKITYFFDGYLFAYEDHMKVEITRPFSSWLAVKFKAKFRNYPYSDYILERYKSDETRFKKLYLLLEEYLNSSD